MRPAAAAMLLLLLLCLNRLNCVQLSAQNFSNIWCETRAKTRSPALQWRKYMRNRLHCAGAGYYPISARRPRCAAAAQSTSIWNKSTKADGRTVCGHALSAVVAGYFVSVRGALNAMQSNYYLLIAINYIAEMKK